MPSAAAARRARAVRRRRPAQVARIIDESDSSLLDVLDNLLNRGVVLNADLVLALANVDLVYVRLSALLCAADRVLAAMKPRDDATLRLRAHVAGSPASLQRLGRRLHCIAIGGIDAIVERRCTPAAHLDGRSSSSTPSSSRLAARASSLLPARFGSVVDEGRAETARRLTVATRFEAHCGWCGIASR